MKWGSGKLSPCLTVCLRVLAKAGFGIREETLQSRAETQSGWATRGRDAGMVSRGIATEDRLSMLSDMAPERVQKIAQKAFQCAVTSGGARTE